MFSLTKALARAEALEKIYDEALDTLERLLQVDRSSILLFDSDSRMRLRAWRGLSEAYCRQAEGHSPWPREAREPAPILIPDAAAGCDVAPLRSLIPAEGIRALAFIPLFAQAKLLGAFALYYDAPHRFTSLEARVAETVASHVAIAIEHKRAEEDLKLYREIFAESSDGITILDRDGRYIALNGAYAELLGYSKEELAGRTPAAHLGEARFAEIAGALARTGRYRGEVTSRARDGRTIQADLSAFSVRDERGEVLCHVGVNRDISHRKRAERRLATQYAVTRLLADSATLASAAPAVLAAVCRLLEWDIGVLWSVDSSAGLLRCIETWHAPGVDVPRFEALSREQTFLPGVGLPGRVWQSGQPAWIVDLAHDDNFPRRAVALAERLHGAGAFPILLGGEVLGVVEFFAREPRPSDRDILEMFSTLAIQIGQIDARKRAQAALARSEQELSDFFENALVPIHWLGPDGRILRANRAELEMLGYTREEYVGRAVAEFHADPDTIQDILDRLAQGETLHNYPARLRCKDGSIRYVRIASNVLWSAGRFVHAHCFTRDVTERIQMEEALRAERKRAEQERDRLLENEQQLRIKAEEASRIKDEFLATVSHELRTPLNAILGWARMLRTRSLAPGTAAQALETIERNARFQARIIEDILDVSRIVTGKLRLAVHPVELAPVIETALESVRPAAEAKNIRLEARLAAAPAVVLGDPDRLQQVAWNLLSNAIKFTPEGGAVETGLEVTGSVVRLTVQDTGNGIPPEFLPYVFDRFRQGDSSTARKHSGLGLGLAIVRHLVELHGGDVFAESPGVGLGATFTVELPLLHTHLSSDLGAFPQGTGAAAG